MIILICWIKYVVLPDKTGKEKGKGTERRMTKKVGKTTLQRLLLEMTCIVLRKRIRWEREIQR